MSVGGGPSAHATVAPGRTWRPRRGRGEAGVTDDEDGPVVCPVCGADFEAVATHDEGVMVTLRDSEAFDRLCFQPVAGESAPLVRFFQHTAEQAGTDSDRPGSAGGRIP